MSESSSSSEPYLSAEEAQRIVAVWERITFTFYYVGFFDPCSAFSKLTTTTHTQGASIPATVLYSLDARRLTGQNVYPKDDEKNQVLQKFLRILKNSDITPSREIFSGTKEKDTFFAIANNILSKLGNNVTLSHETFQSMVKEDHQPSNVFVGKLGMGTPFTWHGYPDARVRAHSGDTNLITMEKKDNPDDSPTSTLGDSCLVEGKIGGQQFNINQLIATTVVSSFIEHNLHGDVNPLTPVIMIGAPKAQICLYDCQQDVLLLSEKFEWVVDTDEDCPAIISAGLLLIWMTIHHRYFLRKLPMSGRNQQYKSSLTTKLEMMGKLGTFRELFEKQSTFKRDQQQNPSASPKLYVINSIRSESPPPLKRFKTK